MTQQEIVYRRAVIAVFVTVLLVAAVLSPGGRRDRESSPDYYDAGIPGLLPAARYAPVLPTPGTPSQDIWSAGGGSLKLPDGGWQGVPETSGRDDTLHGR